MEDLSAQLKAIKLKKPGGPVRDFSSPKTAGFLDPAEISNYQQSVLDVNTEEWLDLLKDHTFPSAYMEMSKEEAELFVRIYESLYQNLDPDSIAKIDWREKVSEEDMKLVSCICGKLQRIINTFIKDENDFVFVKLSSRSPKDAPMAQTRFEKLYEKHLLQEKEIDRKNENIQICCILKAGFESLRVSKAEEVLDMCIRSERTYQDLLLALAIPDRFRENWVVRQFVHIDIDMEFRGFVYDKKLVALSQYNYLIFSERLLNGQKFYSALVEKFFNEEIKSKMEIFVNNYIIDFAVCSNDKIWVIEINPYLTTTDAALFSWEHESSILRGEQQESLVFRITDKPRPGAKSMLPRGMKNLILKCSI